MTINNYASFGKRFLAMLIDSLLIGVISSFSLFLFDYYVWASVSPFIGVIYYVLCEGSTSGATLGKKAMAIKVVNINSNSIGYGYALLRYIGKGISAFILGIGYLMAAFSETSQALHDKIASSYVVDANYVPAYVPPPVPPPPPAPQPQAVQPQIVGIAGVYAGNLFPMNPNGIMMGRDTVACQLVFPESTKGISRHHCVVRYLPETGMFVINDIGSSYGTFLINGTKSGSTPTAIKTGERFYLGSKSNMFEVRV